MQNFRDFRTTIVFLSLNGGLRGTRTHAQLFLRIMSARLSRPISGILYRWPQSTISRRNIREPTNGFGTFFVVIILLVSSIFARYLWFGIGLCSLHVLQWTRRKPYCRVKFTPLVRFAIQNAIRYDTNSHDQMQSSIAIVTDSVLPRTRGQVQITQYHAVVMLYNIDTALLCNLFNISLILIIRVS